MGAFTHDRCAAKVRGIQAFHMDSRGWQDIAYNAVVCPHGYVYEGRGVDRRSAANGTNEGNAYYPAVCYLGGDGDGFTDEGKRGFIDAWTWLGVGGLQKRPHSSFKATACPGGPIRDWINAGAPAPGGGTTPQPQPQPQPTPAHSHPTPLVKNAPVNGVWRGQVYHPEAGKWFIQGREPWWEISDVQQHLRAAGCNIVVDGFGGPNTNHWIVTYQRDRGLAADGIVGPATWRKLHGG